MGPVSEQNFRYYYDGPVMEFNKVIANNWSSNTYAPSARKARSNLTYQFKKQFNRAPSARITLVGEVKRVGGEERLA